MVFNRDQASLTHYNKKAVDTAPILLEVQILSIAFFVEDKEHKLTIEAEVA